VSERAAAGKEMESIDFGKPKIDYRCFENIDVSPPLIQKGCVSHQKFVY